MPSATVRNLEASLEEISNDDTLNTNNDNLYVLSANDGVITLESVSNSNSMSQEDSMDSFDGSDHSLMMKGILHFIQSSIFLLFQCFYQNVHCNII